MTNVYHSVLYTGVTSNLKSRMWQHKNNHYPKSFSSIYKCHKLVYSMFFPHIEEVIAEEKRIKGGSRQMKIDLINHLNIQWLDLSQNFER